MERGHLNLIGRREEASWSDRVGSGGLPDVTEWVADPVVVIDAATMILQVNVAAERFTGRPREELVGSSGVAMVHPSDLAQALLAVESVTVKQVGTPVELRLASVDGWRLVEAMGASMPDGRIVVSFRDLTQRRRWEVAGNEVARFRAVVHNAAMITMLVRRDGTVISVSAAISRLLRLGHGDVCDRPLTDIVDHRDRGAVAATIQAAAMARGGSPQMTIEATLLDAEGIGVPFELSIVPLVDDPTVEGLVISAHDIRRLRAAQEALAELAHFDSLTGLPNRRTFELALEQQWMSACRGASDSRVVVTDLDGFKRLNDDHGHATGDEALRQFAQALRASVREGDVVARIGGDEFAVILVGSGDSASAVPRFEAGLRARFLDGLRRLPMEVGFSIGDASLRAAPSGAAALHTADVAMLRRKRASR